MIPLGKNSKTSFGIMCPKFATIPIWAFVPFKTFKSSLEDLISDDLTKSDSSKFASSASSTGFSNPPDPKKTTFTVNQSPQKSLRLFLCRIYIVYLFAQEPFLGTGFRLNGQSRAGQL